MDIRGEVGTGLSRSRSARGGRGLAGGLSAYPRSTMLVCMERNRRTTYLQAKVHLSVTFDSLPSDPTAVLVHGRLRYERRGGRPTPAWVARHLRTSARMQELCSSEGGDTDAPWYDLAHLKEVMHGDLGRTRGPERAPTRMACSRRRAERSHWTWATGDTVGVNQKQEWRGRSCPAQDWPHGNMGLACTDDRSASTAGKYPETSRNGTGTATVILQ